MVNDRDQDEARSGLLAGLSPLADLCSTGSAKMQMTMPAHLGSQGLPTRPRGLTLPPQRTVPVRGDSCARVGPGPLGVAFSAVEGGSCSKKSTT